MLSYVIDTAVGLAGFVEFLACATSQLKSLCSSLWKSVSFHWYVAGGWTSARWWVVQHASHYCEMFVLLWSTSDTRQNHPTLSCNKLPRQLSNFYRQTIAKQNGFQCYRQRLGSLTLEFPGINSLSLQLKIACRLLQPRTLCSNVITAPCVK